MAPRKCNVLLKLSKYIHEIKVNSLWVKCDLRSNFMFHHVIVLCESSPHCALSGLQPAREERVENMIPGPCALGIGPPLVCSREMGKQMQAPDDCHQPHRLVCVTLICKSDPCRNCFSSSQFIKMRPNQSLKHSTLTPNLYCQAVLEISVPL